MVWQDWLKRNKLILLLVALVGFLLVKDFLPFSPIQPLLRKTGSVPAMEEVVSDYEGAALPISGGSLGYIPPAPDYAPVEQEERLVVEESSMSLVVASVRETADKITDHAKAAGGFMVSTSLSQPEEAPFATVVVRVPAEKFRESLDYFRGLAVKVSSENILGTDVTAEYTDIEARLETLGKTKVKFESIMDQATQVQDILQVQREIIRVQDQIDALKGRQKYLEQTAKLAKVTVYLSTDELALPYAPPKAFRPRVIFKLAVRSLLQTIRSLATTLIWVGVYSFIWLPVVLIGLVVFYLVKKRKKPSPS